MRWSDSQLEQLASLMDVSPRLLAPLKTITELAQLQENWDGYGSPPLHPSAIAGAINVLTISDIEQPPMPYVGPVTGGGVQIEWYTPTRELELEILPDGSLQYVAVDEAGQTTDGELPASADEQVLELVRWLTHKSSKLNLK